MSYYEPNGASLNVRDFVIILFISSVLKNQSPSYHITLVIDFVLELEIYYVKYNR